MKVTQTVHAEPETISTRPAYRVNFWTASGSAWALDAYVLSDVNDVHEVKNWIRGKAHDGPYELFAETEPFFETEFLTPRTSNLVRLAGTNPNEGDSVEIVVFAQDRDPASP